MPVDVSICVVSRRRGASRARLLDSLARLKLSPMTVAEIVVVDADPAGGAEARPDRAGALRIQWHDEPGADAARALECCARAAKGRWAAFVDEDAVVDEDWIAAYVRMADEVEADAFFGPVLPRLAATAHSAFDIEAFYAGSDRPAGATFTVAGAYAANAFVRRSLLISVPFDPDFARARSEGKDCLALALRRGDRFYWCDQAHVHEFIPPERCRFGYLTLRVLEGAAAWSHLPIAKSKGSIVRQLSSTIVRVVTGALRLPIGRLRGRAPAFRAWLELCVAIGRLYGLLGGRVEGPGR